MTSPHSPGPSSSPPRDSLVTLVAVAVAAASVTLAVALTTATMLGYLHPPARDVPGPADGAAAAVPPAVTAPPVQDRVIFVPITPATRPAAAPVVPVAPAREEDEPGPELARLGHGEHERRGGEHHGHHDRDEAREHEDEDDDD